jgi:2-oxoglutarate dehydrogenase complex dehydrogenase (E1) component-like enzyme
VEFFHITDEKERLWCHEKFEELAHSTITPDEKIKAW